jgi:hypothetical protein
MTSRGSGLAERLATAQRILAAAHTEPEVRARFQRRLAAICDAMKIPGAAEDRCARRLDLLLADLRGAAMASGHAPGDEQGEPAPGPTEQGER